MSEFEKKLKWAVGPYLDPNSGEEFLNRPWMFEGSNIFNVNCFLVGANPATPYPAKKLSVQRHIDGLLNREGESCDGIYHEIRGADNNSASRPRIEKYSRYLEAQGLTPLQTNLYCVPSESSVRRLTKEQKEFGIGVFRWALNLIRPGVLILHGVGTAQGFEKIFGVKLDIEDARSTKQTSHTWSDEFSCFICVVPSLAGKGYKRKHDEKRREGGRLAARLVTVSGDDMG